VLFLDFKTCGVSGQDHQGNWHGALSPSSDGQFVLELRDGENEDSSFELFGVLFLAILCLGKLRRLSRVEDFSQRV
jgi:hypothetical protein